MAKSALLKSSVAKKYWMALTGLFLCIFLVGHLIGNLQLVYGTPLQFNQYALFMQTNPAIKVLSYLTYFSIIFHAIDGIVLTIENKKARPIGYAKEKASANSKWASRNMAVLGTLILVFIVMHMMHFWAKMHFSEMPLQKSIIQTEYGDQELYNTTTGGYINVDQIEKGLIVIKNKTELFDVRANLKIGEGYKDLHKITVSFFKDEKNGLWFTLFYVFSMFALGFHLYHGFASAFQSLGANLSKYKKLINTTGIGFSILIPLFFAMIPVYIHFFLK